VTGTYPSAARLVGRLRDRDETVATAESLTGGLIGAALTEVAGSSLVYRGGVIAYATSLKADLAGVAAATLEQCGPVALETAREMAAGVRQRCGAHWGLAVTGVAGPEPQDGHPVGQVFVAVASPAHASDRVVELRLSGSRAEIRAETTAQALDLLEDLLGRPSSGP